MKPRVLGRGVLFRRQRKWHSQRVPLGLERRPARRRRLRRRIGSRDRFQVALAASAIWKLTRTRAPPHRPGRARPCEAPPMTHLISLYKARGVPVKWPLCAICTHATKGKTIERQLTHGVKIWLCAGHASVAFMRAYAGRDFVVSLARIWTAQGCLTRSRSRGARRASGTSVSPPRARDAEATGRVVRLAAAEARGGDRLRTPGSACSRSSAGCASDTSWITPRCRACAPCGAGSRRGAWLRFPAPPVAV